MTLRKRQVCLLAYFDHSGHGNNPISQQSQQAQKIQQSRNHRNHRYITAISTRTAKQRQRQGKARQGKAQQGKARQGTATQGKALLLNPPERRSRSCTGSPCPGTRQSAPQCFTDATPHGTHEASQNMRSLNTGLLTPIELALYA